MADITNREIRDRLSYIEDELLSLDAKGQLKPNQKEILNAIKRKDWNSGLINQALQGISMAGAEEPIAAVKSLIPFGKGAKNRKILAELLNKTDIGFTGSERTSPYDIALALERKDIEDTRQKQPYASFGVEALGGIPTAFAFKKPAGYGSAMKQGGKGGGIYGFLSGEDTLANRLENAGWSVPIGSTFGGVFHGVGRVINEAKNVFYRPNPDLTGKKRARKLIRKMIEDEDAGSVEEIINKILKKEGSKFTLGDSGNNTKLILDYVMNSFPGPGQARALKFLEDRNQGKVGRLIGLFDNLKGSPFSKREARGYDYFLTMRDAFKKKGDNLYKKANILYLKSDNELKSLINTPAFIKAFNTAKRITENKRQPFNVVIENGKLINPKTNKEYKNIPTQFLHYIKMGLDENIYTGRKDVSNIGKAEMNSIQDVRHGLLNWLDAKNPTYKNARNIYANEYALMDALELGTNIRSGKIKYHELVDMVTNMSKSEKQAFQLGAMDAYTTILEKSSLGGAQQKGGGDLTKSLANSVKDKNLMRLVFDGDDEAFNKFWANLVDESIMAQNSSSWIGNSATARRQAIQDYLDIEDPTFLNKDLNLTNVVRDMIGTQLEGLNLKEKSAVNNELARILTEAKPEELRIILAQLKGKMSIKEIAQSFPEYFGKIANLVGTPTQAPPGIGTMTGLTSEQGYQDTVKGVADAVAGYAGYDSGLLDKDKIIIDDDDQKIMLQKYLQQIQ